jgi:hypothetical protein
MPTPRRIALVPLLLALLAGTGTAGASDSGGHGNGRVGVAGLGRVLLVPGWCSTRGTLRSRPFHEHRRRLGDRAVLSRHDTRRSQVSNVPRLARLIESMPEIDTVMSHSQGGLLVLRTLLRYPQLRRKLRSWLPVQTPIFGSKRADQWLQDLTAGGIRGLASRVALPLWTGGADWRAVVELGTDHQLAFMQEHADAIGDLLHELPVLAVTSEGDRVVLHHRAILPERPYLLYGTRIGHLDLVDGKAKRVTPEWQWLQFQEMVSALRF